MAFNYLITGLSNKDILLNSLKDSTVSSLMNGFDITSQFMFVHNGSPIEDLSMPLEITPSEEQSHLVIIRAYRRVLGGKGGFGALIRAMGMRMNRNRNKDACRDLTGRRLRAVNTEKKVTELMKKAPERRKKEAKEKKEKRRLLLEGPRHQFNDVEYIEQLEATHDNLEDALKQGLLASGSDGNGGKTGPVKVAGKRKGINNGEYSSKRRKIWLTADEEVDDTTSDDESDTDEENEERINEEVPLINEGSTPGIPTLSVPVIHEDVPVISNSPKTQLVQDIPISSIDSHAHSNSPPAPVSANTDTVTDAGNGDDVVSITTDQSNINPSATPFSYEDFDLNSYKNMEELMEIGSDNLKTVLQRKGLKCGGTPHERAVRLWSVKGRDLTEIDPSLLASSNGRKRSRNKGKKK